MWQSNFVVFALSTTGSNIIQAQSASALDNNWHHVAGIFDGSSIKLAVDGNVVQTTNFSGSIHPNDVLFHVGGYTSGTDFFASFPGLIDDVRVTKRALAPSELGFFAPLLEDTDGDCVLDTEDNCLNTPNDDQSDQDLDGVGDACDCAADNPNEPGEDGVCPGCGINAAIVSQEKGVGIGIFTILLFTTILTVFHRRKHK